LAASRVGKSTERLARKEVLDRDTGMVFHGKTTTAAATTTTTATATVLEI